MKDIDGYVTKDNLYRLISQIKRNPDFVVDDKTCSIIVDKISKMEKSDVQPVKELQKLHMCVAEIFRQAKRIEMFADNWDTRDPCSPDYKFIITAVNLIQAFDKQIHNELFPEMIAEYKKEDK